MIHQVSAVLPSTCWHCQSQTQLALTSMQSANQPHSSLTTMELKTHFSNLTETGCIFVLKVTAMIGKINIHAVFSPEGVLCGLRNAEFQNRIICQIVGAEFSANYTW